jgi:hypothetical protein
MTAWSLAAPCSRRKPRQRVANSQGSGRRVAGSLRKLIITPLVAYLAKLRFPALFAITAVLFVLNFFIPDVIPFVDEILLGLGAALLGSWKKRKEPGSADDKGSQ